MPAPTSTDLLTQVQPEDRPWLLWRLQARRNQLPPPGDWLVWLLLAGRGYGKGKAASNWLARKAWKAPEGSEFVVLAPTYSLVRRVCVEGPSGLLAALGGEAGPLIQPKGWNRSMGELRLRNGATIFAVSADEPDRLRGLNLSGGWVDELCSMDRADMLWNEALIPALRVGHPRLVVSTTPRPTPLLRDLVARDDGSVSVVRGSTWENADNLPDEFLAELRARYEGTRLGRQELEAEILEDVEGALWSRAWFDRPGFRVAEHPDLSRVVVAVDPAVTATATSDETGIVVAGRSGWGATSEGWVLDDRSVIASPAGWGERACLAAHEHQADALVYESNQGGDMVAHVLHAAWGDLRKRGEVRDPMPALTPVRASRGKQARAEPVAAQYEQGRWHHCGFFGDLEDELTTWVPGTGDSPDRLDALVWAGSELLATQWSSAVATGSRTLAGARMPSTSGSAVMGRRTASPLLRGVR